jgi:hypothetical protein
VAGPPLGRGGGELAGEVRGRQHRELPVDPAVAGVEPVHDQQQFAQPCPQVAVLRGGRELLGVAAHAGPDGRGEQAVAGGEVAEHGAPVDQGRLGHVVDRGGQAALGQHDPGGAQDPGAGEVALLDGERRPLGHRAMVANVTGE